MGTVRTISIHGLHNNLRRTGRFPFLSLYGTIHWKEHGEENNICAWGNRVNSLCVG